MSSPGLILQFCINKTGSSQPAVDVESGQTVGELYNREAFIFYGGEGGLASIEFLGPNGTRANAMVNRDNVPCFENPATCFDYPYGRVALSDDYGNPKEYYTFLMRRTMNIYKYDGTYWGKVAANMLVAVDGNAPVGVTHPDWIEIKYVQKSPTREWIKVESDNSHKYGFVDTGIFSASGHSTIPFYGSW